MSEIQETVTISLQRYHRLQEAEARLHELTELGKDPECKYLRIETHPHGCITGYAKTDIVPLIRANNSAIEKWRAEMREAAKPKPTFLQRIFRRK